MLMIFMATMPRWLYVHVHVHTHTHTFVVEGVEIQRVPDQRQNELLAEFERRKKVGHY